MGQTQPLEDQLLDKRISHEQALIGCAIIGRDEVRQECGWLKPDSFHDQPNRTFWQRFQAGDEPLAAAVEVGMPYYVKAIGWARDCEASYVAPTHAHEVARLAHVNRQMERIAQLAKAAALGDYATYQRLVQELASETPATERKVRTAQEVGLSFLELIQHGARVIPTYIPPIDRAISGGLERQTLCVLAARPSMGKSGLAFQVARNVAQSGGKALFVSLEMSEANLWARAACGEAGTTWARIKGGLANATEQQAVARKTFELMERYGPRLMIHDQDATTETIWEMTATERPDVVIVDHLRNVGDRDGDNENKRLGLISQRLKRMAVRLDCNVLLLAQLNRNPEHRSDQRPQLSELRDSGEIEENADLVLMPYRDGYYNPQREQGTRSRTEVWVRKARDGQLNLKICLMYDLCGQWFDEPTEKEWPMMERVA